jgi:hypothetical protein
VSGPKGLRAHRRIGTSIAPFKPFIVLSVSGCQHIGPLAPPIAMKRSSVERARLAFRSFRHKPFAQG